MQMGREARKRSSTGIYHIMLRGIDKRDIFLDDEDKIRFMKKLMKEKETDHLTELSLEERNNNGTFGEGWNNNG